MAEWSPETLERRLKALAVRDPEPAPERRAAVAIALALVGPPRVLLIRRAAREGDPWSGQVALPGGRREPEDRNLRATAVREAREEVGLDLEADARWIGRLAPRRARARGRLLDMDVSPFVFALSREVVPAINAEAEEAFWLPLERAAVGELDHVHLYTQDDGARIRLPAWRFEERVVWGMTHRILFDLLDAVQGRRGG